MTEATARFKDFTRDEEPVTFQIGDDIFVCAPEVPLDVLLEMAELASGIQGANRAEQINRVKQFLGGVMEEDSMEIFLNRMKRGAKKPIGMLHFKDIMQWMMEVYGLRPTQQSSESPSGSEDEDSSSMDGVSPTESTS